MPKFGARSKANLAYAHPLLQQLMAEAIKETDFTVTDARRGRIAQESAFAAGNSKVHFGDSAHNYVPCVALDIYPSPIPRNMDTKAYRARLKAMQTAVKRAADWLGIPIRQGIDFNRNGDLTDDNFVDLPHVELYPWRDFAKKSKLFEG